MGKASKLFFMSTGAALAWFLDPVSGAERRRQLAEQLSGLTGQIRPPSDPTGGAGPATPPAAPPPSSSSPDDPTLLQAVEAASAGEKVLRRPAGGDDGGDTRATLRTNW